MRSLRLGTRGSQLAVTQSQWVADLVTARTGRPVTLVIVRTRGDEVTDRPLAMVGGKGLFTLELEAGLLDGSIDFAVHSLKDLPTEDRAGLVVAAVPEREDPRDVVVGGTLLGLPAGARVGTGSARRAHQVTALRPDLQVVGVRGNVDTRVAKQRSGEYDAVILAAAGLHRLGRAHDISEHLDPDLMVPAPGQGALGVQCRADDASVRDALSRLDHPDTAVAVAVERSFLHALSGGCSVPAGCFAVLDRPAGRIRARAVLGTEAGLRRAEVDGDLDAAVALGRSLAEQVRS
jgi:hydroxymethylbilane synthase